MLSDKDPENTLKLLKGILNKLETVEGVDSHTLSELKELITLLQNNKAKQINRHKMLEEIPAMLWQCDLKGNFSFINKTLLEFIGYESLQNFPSGFLQLIHPEDRKNFKKILEKSLKEEKSFFFEYRLNDRYNNYRWVLNHAHPFYNKNGKCQGLIANCTDIHDRIVAEQRLLESEDKYRRMFEDTSLGIFRFDRNFRFVSANKAFAFIFGYDNEKDFLKEINEEPSRFFPDFPRDKDLIIEIIKSRQKQFVIEKHLKDRHGKSIYVIIHLKKVHDRKLEREFYVEGYIEDITQRKIAENNLQISEQKFKALFEKSYNAILILDKQQIIDCNYKAAQLFNSTIGELTGKQYYELCATQQEGINEIKKLLKTKFSRAMSGHAESFELLHKRDETSFDAEVSFSRIFINQKPLIQAIVRDVSQRKLFEKQLKQAKDDAEKARMAQSEFLSLMSHEIRTPLNAVVSLTELLLHDDLTSDQLENLNSVKLSAKHLLGLIDDILDFNKIETGNLEFEYFDFDIRSLVSDLHKTLEIKASEKNIKLITKINDNVPEILRADTLRLKQVLFNMLSNAIKFTEEGYVSLKIEKRPGCTDGKNIHFEVMDTGIGIASDRLDAIFEKFTQAETSIRRKYGGSGLGLTICKKLVEMQEGKIYARSKPGQGSVFSFYLPMETGKKKFPAPEKDLKGELHKSLEGLKVLMVEDDKMNQFVGRKVIDKKWKADLTIVATAEEALDYLAKESFDLVLMDLLLPGMDGYEATKNIRSNPDKKFSNPSIPVIALTADAFMETRKKAYEAGVDDFVTKPFDYQKLFEKISRYKPAG